MPKRLFDRLTLFGRARLDVTIATGALRPTHGRYAVDLFHVSDPSRFRDEAVATLHELLNLGGRGHFRSEEHTSELQSRLHLVCRLLLEKKKKSCPVGYRSLGPHQSRATCL